MVRSYFSVTLVNGTSQKTVKVSATSRENAGYEAQRQNSGWTVKDVQAQ